MTAGPPNGRAGRHDQAGPHDQTANGRAPHYDRAGRHDRAARHEQAANGRADEHDRPSGPPELTFFVHLSATPAWLALSRRERQQVIAHQVAPLLGEHPGVAVRWFDAEAWSARPSDILMATTTDPRAWTELFEQLRGTALWSVPYFEVELIVPGAEEASARRPGRHGSAYSARHGSTD